MNNPPFLLIYHFSGRVNKEKWGVIYIAYFYTFKYILGACLSMDPDHNNFFSAILSNKFSTYKYKCNNAKKTEMTPHGENLPIIESLDK